MQSRISNDAEGSPRDYAPVVSQLSFQQSLQPSIQQSLSIEPALTADSNASKIGKHNRRNSTVQEQRAVKLKRQETRRMLSLPKEVNEPINPAITTARYIPWGIDKQVQNVKEFKGNSVSTAKYDKYFITFVPRFLFEMFTRVAYLYFLIQAGLSWWDVVSPFAGYGATLALAFVLAAAAIKAIVEDRKRHVEDHKTNNSATVVMGRDADTGEWHESQKKWTEVKVGDVVKVSDNELFPADLMCLHCALEERICFVKTTNLDGETNLKVKRQVLGDDFYDEGWTEEALLGLQLQVECEFPNSNLHTFRGRVGVKKPHQEAVSEKIMPIQMSQMLLRGCMLKNSKYIYGLVVYTGSETRIQQNSAAAPLKIGAFDHFLNMQVAILICGQVMLCILCAVLSWAWRKTEGFERYYLALDFYVQGNAENGFVYTLLVFITFWILFSYLVPISLFVTLEIVKFWQGFVFINADPEMREDGEGAKCRNSNLNEDLGKVDYIFSDKTGTLTSNEMRLRLVAIKGVPQGDLNRNLEDHPGLHGMAALKLFSDNMHDSLLALQNDNARWEGLLRSAGSPPDILRMADSRRGPAAWDLGERAGHFLPYHVFDFWLNLALCHALLVETDDDGTRSYQGPSPDEVALVECARTVGFEYVSRSASETTLSIFGKQVTYETLYVMEFSSERQRMSVIVRCPDGTIKLFCKGADAMMLQRLSEDVPEALRERVNDNLHFFSTKGLRTLIIGTRTIDPQFFEQWSERYEQAQGNLLDAKVGDRCMDEIENGLELVGVTAIEDKLQGQVPASIATLLDAGIKVWMITGDKQETAINIAVSCRLFTNTDNLLVCNAGADDVRARIEHLINQADSYLATDTPTELVVDGKTLTHVLGHADVEAALALLGSKCTAVVVCRASPSQKANIVTMMREYELRLARAQHRTALGRWFAKLQRNLGGKMLAIGDGANDVAMIQAADVGIGIAGKEGRQAVNNSDYAIAQFRFLTRLLLVHGQLSRYRLGRLIKYSFYKNSVFAGVLFYFQLYNGFSGQTLVDDISAAVYNVVFTSLPILFFSLLDRPCRRFAALLRYPRTYNKSLGLSVPIFWKSGVLHAFIDAAVCFFVPFLAASPRGAESATDIFSIGKTITICMLGIVTMEIMIVARYWTWWFGLICAVSYGLLYPYVLLFPLVLEALDIWDMAQYAVGANIMRMPYFWLSVISVYSITFSIRYFERSTKWLFRPDDNMIRAELEVRAHRRGEGGSDSKVPALESDAAVGYVHPDMPGGVRSSGGAPAELDIESGLPRVPHSGSAAQQRKGHKARSGGTDAAAHDGADNGAPLSIDPDAPDEHDAELSEDQHRVVSAYARGSPSGR